MSPMHVLQQLIPASAKRFIGIRREQRSLASVPRVTGSADNLRPDGSFDLAGLWGSAEASGYWQASRQILDRFAIPDGTGGVNPGDRRAVHYLIGELKPSAVLEIGTHIGASTIHIATALRAARADGSHLVTVDCADVNDPESRPWIKYGAALSPRDMIVQAGCERSVEFVHDTSLNYARGCRRRFDFIFLDGGHGAETVYAEIPMALALLEPNGAILLHDYFPGLKPLWSNGVVIPGPFLAVERLIAEGLPARAVPLGELPWPTKENSRTTSLALLLKTG
jgi:predicted O-methyltransferase YrrM